MKNLINKKLLSMLSSGFLALMLSVSFVQASESFAVDQSNPQKMIAGLSDYLMTALNQNRTELEADNKKVIEFSEKNVLPYVDTEKMARYALGKHWRNASAAQQKAFTAAFTENLIRSYSKSFLNLQIDKVEVGNAQTEKEGRATVDSTVYQKEGKSVDVLYRLYQSKEDQKWYLYDVVIENVSMLLSYRSVYGDAVEKQGLDNVIASMVEKNKQVEVQ